MVEWETYVEKESRRNVEVKKNLVFHAVEVKKNLVFHASVSYYFIY